MQYKKICDGVFLSRPNRFVAWVDCQGEQLLCHVKNTGRCAELLVPGARVILSYCHHPKRRTQWDLVVVEKEGRWINMDAQAPNQVVREWMERGDFRPGLRVLQGEKTFLHSRFDFYWETQEEKGFLEVKGVTLEQDGVTYFPDAPTERGVRHLKELIEARKAGYQASVCFILQMSEARAFTPNQKRHPAFGETLRRAAQEGVEVLAWCCHVTPDTIEIKEPVEVWL